SHSLVQILFIGAAIFAPFMFGVWMLSDRKLSREQWVFLIALMLVGAIVTRILVVVILAGCILLAVGIGWLWHKFVLYDVVYTRRVEPTQLFPGETATIGWSLLNNKPLPISWIRWQEHLPVSVFGSREEEGLIFEGVDVRPRAHGGGYSIDQVSSLRSYETLVNEATVLANRRGYYPFAPVNCTASDVLGLFAAERTFEQPAAITVYPRLLS